MGKHRKLNLPQTHLLKFILLSRFRTLNPTPQHKAYASYVSVGQVVGLSSTTVRKLCLQCINRKIRLDTLPRQPSKRIQGKNIAKRKYFGVVTREHIQFLTSQTTLKKQVGLSLEQRAALFHESFPLVKITRSMLQKIYKRHGIKRKAIREVKTLNPK